MIAMICLPLALILMSSFEEAVGRFHPIVLHFPIVLFSAALGCDLLSCFNKLQNYKPGSWMIIVGLLSCIPTLITGLAAAESMDPNNIILLKHKSLAFTTAFAASVYAGIRIALMWWLVVVPGWFYVAASVIMVALVSWTSDYGGLLTRSDTPFSSREIHEVALMHNHKDSVTSSPKIPMNELQDQLSKSIGVSDVIPIFKAHNCQKCHQQNFEDGKPINFSNNSNPDETFLPRDPDGKLVDITQSNFYRSVIVENSMPKGPKSMGLSPSERLTLLMWLKNGAPMQ